jgi:hypothetical protein
MSPPPVSKFSTMTRLDPVSAKKKLVHTLLRPKEQLASADMPAGPFTCTLLPCIQLAFCSMTVGRFSL